MQINRKDVVVRNWNVALMTPRIWLAFFTILTWSSTFKYIICNYSKIFFGFCFSELAVKHKVISIRILCGEVKNFNYITLKCNSHSNNQHAGLSKSLCSCCLQILVGDWCNWKIILIQVLNPEVLHFWHHSMLTYCHLLVGTLCFLPDKKESIQHKVFALNPVLCGLHISLLGKV